MKIDEVEVKFDAKEFGTDEIKYYVEVAKNKFPDDKILTLIVTLEDDGRVRLEYTKQGRKFERIRRITGYLTGDLTTWNDAKKSEERERVKHE